MEHFNINKIKKESEKILITHGLSSKDASLVIDSMLEADMAGISTHGIRMLPSYVEKINKGFFSIIEPEVIKKTASFSIVDAHGTIGAISADYCVKIAIKGAKESGIYTVLSRNSNTFGAASYFADKMAQQGIIGIAFCNSPAAMPVANGAEPMLGTNPIAFSCPSKSYGPIIMDMAISVVAKSKFELYRQEGKELPDGWALDSNGNPTNDPASGIKGLVLPMAGFKGYCLAMMIDIIAGALSGAAYLNTVNKFYSASNEPMNVGHSFIAVDPMIVYGDKFFALMDDYIEKVKESKATEGKKIIIPGDRRKEEKKKAEEKGISLSQEDIKKLTKILISGNATEIDFREKFGGGIELVYHENEWVEVEEPESFDIVICNNLFKYNKIEKFTKLRFIQLTSSGIDRLPIEYLKQEGIRFRNAKGVYDIPIAEYTVGRILEWYKRFRETDRSVQDHVWKKQRKLQEIYDKTAAIYGYGGIGREIAKRLSGFGTRIIAISRTYKSDQFIDEWTSSGNSEKALSLADIVIITAPLTEETKGLVDIEFLKKVKADALLVNVSRGEIVDKSALIESLGNKSLSGAILDVFAQEPLPQDDPLWECENCLISPHNSFESICNITRLEKLIIKNIQEEVYGDEKD